MLGVMSIKSILLDPVSPHILVKLYPSREMRYIELKTALNLSDSTLSKRLDELRKHGLVEIKAIDNPSGRNYIVYRLTDLGRKVVETLKLKDFLERLEGLTLA
jgi:DNA-binding HxlR family transcriptional regulator